jgi:hypothetical protein
MGLGVAEDQISLEATEATFPFSFNYFSFKKLLTEVHLLAEVVMQPPSPDPRASPMMHPQQPYSQLPFAHGMPFQPHAPPLMPPLMQSPSQHFTPLTPPTPPSAASSTSAPSPTPTVLAFEARVSALETQLQNVDSKLDRLLACMAAQAPADGPPTQRQRTA